MSKRFSRRLIGELMGKGDGNRTDFLPSILGKPTRLTTEVDAVYRTDWRGRVPLSRQYRSNLLYCSDVLMAKPGIVNADGDLPPGWNIPRVTGLYREVVGVGHLDDGTPYLDLRIYNKNNTALLKSADVVFNSQPMPTNVGHVWTLSAGVQIIAGDSASGFEDPVRRLVIAEVDATGQRLQSSGVAVRPGAPLTRLVATRKVTDPRTAAVSCYIEMTILPRTAVDLTLRISAPQVELGSVATAYIPTRNGEPAAPDYVIDERNRVTVTEPPPLGATITWDGTVNFDLPESLLPPNATGLERVAEAVTACVAQVDTVVDLLWNPWTCPENLLPWLAWAMSVDTWRSSWPLPVKRARVAGSLLVQRRKGTARSIADVVGSFGGSVEITEWWQTSPRGQPHTFALTLTLSGQSGETATAQYVDDVIAEVNLTKPVRSHFTFTQGVSVAGRIGVVAGTHLALLVRLQATEAPTP
jgi:phage tail P2-like protein